MSFRRRLLPTVVGGLALWWVGAASAADGEASRWVAAWATALQPIPEMASPPPLYRTPEVAGRTLREIVYPSVAGDKVRVRISNAYGRAPLSIGSARIARSAGTAAVRGDIAAQLSFGGRRDVVLAPGEERDSDPVSLPVEAGAPYAISLFVHGEQKLRAWHRVSNQINYVSTPGDHAADTSGDAYKVRITQSAWVSELAVEAGPNAVGAIAAVGDSITDGMRSSLNRNRRWPDGLDRRLDAAGARQWGVVNLGISGNRLLSDSACYGVALERRFERDVLARSGVKAAVLLVGINDINFQAMPPRAGLDCDAPHTKVDARALIQGYRRLIVSAHAKGIALFGATLTPASLPAEREAIRVEVNHWIRTSGAFDGVVDFDAALRDPSRPQIMQRRYDSGDNIHPSDAGYAAMADAVPIDKLLEAAKQR
ncbi:SGNH/GDSL hydrolase family protein [Burkholderia gladioli]|uniref:SGNH/GDSL hydrolase family protein n=1 Tax=Burkholderia gladioli TaxID=28095 RepID=UPI00163EB082|nr:SGNH/GDSL hydrolase family protein [Burkholderia gladioli]